jgi:hypothetical protein
VNGRWQMAATQRKTVVHFMLACKVVRGDTYVEERMRSKFSWGLCCFYIVFPSPNKLHVEPLSMVKRRIATPFAFTPVIF